MSTVNYLYKNTKKKDYISFFYTLKINIKTKLIKI